MSKLSTAGKTTCTFRIEPNAKLALAETAKELHMSPSQYVEALVMEQHDLFVNSLEAKQREKKIVFSESMYQLIREHLSKLKKRYPESSIEQMIAASLDHAFSNYGAIVQRSFKTSLRRISNQILKLKNQAS